MQALYNLVSFIVPGSTSRSRSMGSVCNERLGAVLDGEPEAAHVLGGAGAGDGEHQASASNEAADEANLARLKAEAVALDASNRLRVAQEQLAEYAAQKERDTEVLLQCAEAAVACLAPEGGPAHADAAALLVQTLRDKVAEAALEARAFAAQQKADVETLKRSSQQANLAAGDQDVDMKRAREGADGEATDANSGDDDAPANGNSSAANGHHDDEDASMGSAAGSQDAAAAQEQHAREEGARGADAGPSFVERARYIPMRLGQDERRLLRLLEAALNVSEYTDKVDILSHRNKSARVVTQIKDICAILSGLLVAQDYRRGQDLIRDRNFKDNEEFFQAVFEVGRRYKIMNPDKMRSEYGKLMYLLMDSADHNVQDLLEFKCVSPLRTVYSVLEQGGGLRMLEDQLMHVATAEIKSANRSRYDVQRDIKAKERAREQLSRRYRTHALKEDDLLQCLYALSDNNSYLLFNRDPIDRMIMYFTHFFRSEAFEQGFSLAIQGGREGARLTHNHSRQYTYVLQSLTLWREISTDMFRLWYLAEADLLSESNGYRLVDTGQGLNRVQSAPHVSRAMQQILARCQARIGSWVGSSVVHLGDHNVPNALHFIDKYTQVPRILNPVVAVLEAIPKLNQDPEISAYLESAFGGAENCLKAILADFCRHAFDGSGADNFFDAGSCIDGRLTSAWNWCSKLEKKPYYPVFKLAGFTSFDGDFK